MSTNSESSLCICLPSLTAPLDVCSVFSIPSSDDEVKDLLLLRRIKMLRWLEPVHLDLPLNLQNPEVQGMVSKGREGEGGRLRVMQLSIQQWFKLVKAELNWHKLSSIWVLVGVYTELWAMDSKKAPQDKLNCISKCSTYLMSALRHSQGSPASADDFLPVLIFLLIHSNPQHLHSNIKSV